MGRPNLAVLGLDDHVFTFSPLYLSLYPFCIFASFYVVLSSKNIVYEQLLQVWVPTGTRIWINKGRGMCCRGLWRFVRHDIPSQAPSYFMLIEGARKEEPEFVFVFSQAIVSYVWLPLDPRNQTPK